MSRGGDWRRSLRRVALVISVAVPVAGFADDPVDARREDRAEHLLTEHFETWVDEIAGFNRRNAMCDADSAKAAAAYDAAHRTAFKRTLGWRFDDGAARWVPASPKQAQVTLIYSGPVRSGTVTLGGEAQSFCRAEAPDKIETWAVDVPNKGVPTSGYSLALPALPPGFDAAAGTAAPPDTGASTPRGEIDSRIAKAASLLAEAVAGADAFVAQSRKDSVCTETKAGEMSRRVPGLTKSLARTDGPLRVEIAGKAYSGPVKEGEQTTWLCLAMRPPLQFTATAGWQAEGDDELIFHDETPTKP